MSMTGRAVTGVNLFGMGGVAVLQWSMGVVIGSFARDAGGHYPLVAYVAAFGMTIVGGLVVLARYAPLARQAQPAAPRRVVEAVVEP